MTILDGPPAAVTRRQQSWTVAAADELLEEFDASPAAQAAELHRKAEAFEDGVDAALAIADELGRRARIGVRFLPGSQAAVRARRAGQAEPSFSERWKGGRLHRGTAAAMLLRRKPDVQYGGWGWKLEASRRSLSP